MEPSTQHPSSQHRQCVGRLFGLPRASYLLMQLRVRRRSVLSFSWFSCFSFSVVERAAAHCLYSPAVDSFDRHQKSILRPSRAYVFAWVVVMVIAALVVLGDATRYIELYCCRRYFIVSHFPSSRSMLTPVLGIGDGPSLARLLLFLRRSGEDDFELTLLRYLTYSSR